MIARMTNSSSSPSKAVELAAAHDSQEHGPWDRPVPGRRSLADGPFPVPMLVGVCRDELLFSIGLRAIHLSRLRWCDAVPRLAGWCPVPAFARRVPVMVRHGGGLFGLSGVAALAGRVRLPTM